MAKKRITEAVTSTDALTKRWKMMFSAARMAYETAEFHQAESLMTRAAEVAHQLTEKSFAEPATEIGCCAILIATRRTKEAAKRLEHAKSELASHHDDSHQELLAVAMRFHAQALADRNELPEAERELQQSVEILKKLGPDASVQMASSLSDLCGLYLLQGRHSDAETSILSAMKILSSNLGPENADYVRADMIYQLCLPLQADSRLEATADNLQKMEYAFGEKHPNITRAVNRYMAHLHERGETAKMQEVNERFGLKAGSR